MPAYTNKVQCPMCGVEKRVGDHIIAHIRTHCNDVPLYMTANAIQYSINNKIPIMCRITNTHKNEKGDYAMCMVCKEVRYYGGRKSIYEFYTSHRNCDCKDEWDTVEPLFTKVLTESPPERLPVVIDKHTLLMNQMKKLLSEIKAKTATLESKINEYTDATP